MLYAYLLFEKEDFEYAVRIIDLGIKRNPLHIDLLFEKASIYRNLKKHDQSFQIQTPLVNVKEVSEKLNISKEAANELVKKFEKVGVLREITAKQRCKGYSFKEYIEIIARGTKDKS